MYFQFSRVIADNYPTFRIDGQLNAFKVRAKSGKRLRRTSLQSHDVAIQDSRHKPNGLSCCLWSYND